MRHTSNSDFVQDVKLLGSLKYDLDCSTSSFIREANRDIHEAKDESEAEDEPYKLPERIRQ